MYLLLLLKYDKIFLYKTNGVYHEICSTQMRIDRGAGKYT